MKHILILAANPEGTTPLRLDREVRAIDQALRESSLRAEFQLHQRWALRPRDLQRALLEINPEIVHFCGHGEGLSGLAFEDNAGETKLVSAQALAGLFKMFSSQVECVLLNACYAKHQAEAIAHHIDYVIGMKQAIEDSAAIAFSVGFYDALGSGETIERAFEFGCAAIHLQAAPTTSSRSIKVVGASEENSYSPSNLQHLVPVLIKKSKNGTAHSAESADSKTVMEELLAASQAGEQRISQLEKGIELITQQVEPNQALKEALKWLEKRQSLAEKASTHVFQTVATVKDWTGDDKEEFRWEIEKYLEFVYYSMLTGTNELLDEPPIMPTYDNPRAYMTAFGYIKDRILPRIDINTTEQIKTNFDYLFDRIFR